MIKLTNVQNMILDSYELILKLLALTGILLTLPLMLALVAIAALLLLPLIPFITKAQNQTIIHSQSSES